MNRTGDPMPNLFARAASLLLGDNAGRQRRPRCPASVGGAWLCGRSRIPAGGGKSGPRARHRAHLLKAASRFMRVFELAAPDAPGLVSFGAEFDPALADPLHAGSPAVSVSGVGLSLQEAFQGCIGEGIEYLSQLQTGSDVLEPSDAGDPAAALGPRRRDFSPPSRPTACARMPNFHGTVPRGSPIVARSCCRQICACAGRRTSKRSSRRFR